ncbi:ANTAR domain-containing protein [Jatrophihabitans sp. YIM 134969]
MVHGHDDAQERSATDRVEELQRQREEDLETIAGLQEQSQVDREILASLVEQGVADRAEIEQLQAALVAARRIGAAMGILMATLKVDEDGAFDRLRTASQHTNRKLRDVAGDVVYAGALPD